MWPQIAILHHYFRNVGLFQPFVIVQCMTGSTHFALCRMLMPMLLSRWCPITPLSALEASTNSNSERERRTEPQRFFSIGDAVLRKRSSRRLYRIFISMAFPRVALRKHRCLSFNRIRNAGSFRLRMRESSCVVSATEVAAVAGIRRMPFTLNAR